MRKIKFYEIVYRGIFAGISSFAVFILLISCIAASNWIIFLLWGNFFCCFLTWSSSYVKYGFILLVLGNGSRRIPQTCSVFITTSLLHDTHWTSLNKGWREKIDIFDEFKFYLREFWNTYLSNFFVPAASVSRSISAMFFSFSCINFNRVFTKSLNGVISILSTLFAISFCISSNVCCQIDSCLFNLSTASTRPRVRSSQAASNWSCDTCNNSSDIFCVIYTKNENKEKILHLFLHSLSVRFVGQSVFEILPVCFDGL